MNPSLELNLFAVSFMHHDITDFDPGHPKRMHPYNVL